MSQKNRVNRKIQRVHVLVYFNSVSLTGGSSLINWQFHVKVSIMLEWVLCQNVLIVGPYLPPASLWDTQPKMHCNKTHASETSSFQWKVSTDVASGELVHCLHAKKRGYFLTAHYSADLYLLSPCTRTHFHNNCEAFVIGCLPFPVVFAVLAKPWTVSRSARKCYGLFDSPSCMNIWFRGYSLIA